jgi:prefoldin subunit 5
MDSSFSMEYINHRLDELQQKVQKLEAEREEIKNLQKNYSNEEQLKIIDTLNRLDDAINLIGKERLVFLDLMKIQIEKGNGCGRINGYVSIFLINRTIFIA